MVIATRRIMIGRPLAMVSSQFADVSHHERTHVHRNAQFTVLEASATHCDYRQLSRQGPFRIRQQFHLDRSDLTHQTNTVTGGSFRGDTITFDIEATEPDSTAVTATLRSSRKLMSAAALVLRPVLGRALGAALAEDKRDIESGSYRQPEADHLG